MCNILCILIGRSIGEFGRENCIDKNNLVIDVYDSVLR